MELTRSRTTTSEYYYAGSSCSTRAPYDERPWLSSEADVPEDRPPVEPVVELGDLDVLLKVSRPLVDDDAQVFLCSAQAQGFARLPVDIVCAVDTSGSMVGHCLQAAKAALLNLSELLNSDDRLSVVAFNDVARVLCGLASAAEAREAIVQLRAEGGTQIGAGLKASLGVLEKRRSPNPSSAVVLLTDGLDNDTRPIESKLSELRDALALHCEVYSLGFGEADFELLRRISSEFSYPFAWVDSPESIAAALGNVLRLCRGSIARAATLAVLDPDAHFLTAFKVAAPGRLRLPNLVQGDVKVLVRSRATRLRAELEYTLADGKVGRASADSGSIGDECEGQLGREEDAVREELFKFRLAQAAMDQALRAEHFSARPLVGLERLQTAIDENCSPEEVMAMASEVLLQRRVTS